MATLAENPLLRLIGAAFSLFFIVSAVYIIPFEVLVGTFVGVTFSLIFFLYPARKGREKTRPTILDLVLSVGSLAAGGYFAIQYEAMQMRAGLVTDQDVVFGIIAIIVSLEAARRMIGWTLPVIAVLLIGYNYLGPWLPDGFQHPGFSFGRIVSKSFHGTGIFGIVASTYARYVVLFIIFGAMLQALGTGAAIMRLSQALTRGRRAGAAKAAILASGGIGSIMGSGVANIAVTGPLTIPAMKREGLTPERAGAVETVASVGGQLLPPVMGAGAFLLAQFSGVPYREVIAVALVPGLLYYISLYAAVHFGAKRDHIVRSPSAADDPAYERPLDILRETYWTLLPVPILITAILWGYSEFRAAFWAILATILIALLRERSLKSVGLKAYEGLSSAALGATLVIASTAGVIGIVIAMLDLPGILITFSATALNLVEGKLFLAYLMIIFISLVLGMGMTVTASYVIVAVLAAPVLGDLGVPLVVAHLVVFWLSQDSTVTPPFALGAFVAGGIAGGNVFRTSIIAFFYAKPLYIIPLMMIYTPLVSGTWAEILATGAAAAIGLILLAAALEGFFYKRCSVPTRLFLAATGALLLFPSYWAWAVGATMAMLLWTAQRRFPAASGRLTGV